MTRHRRSFKALIHDNTSKHCGVSTETKTDIVDPLPRNLSTSSLSVIIVRSASPRRMINQWLARPDKTRPYRLLHIYDSALLSLSHHGYCHIRRLDAGLASRSKYVRIVKYEVGWYIFDTGRTLKRWLTERVCWKLSRVRHSGKFRAWSIINRA